MDEENSQTFKKLVARRGIVKSQLTRFENFLNACTFDTLKEKRTFVALQTRLDDSKNLVGEFEKVQGAIEDFCLDLNLLDQLTQQDKERDSFETRYYDLISRGKILMDMATPAVTHNPQDTNIPSVLPSTSYGVHPSARLPPIPLPEFSGNYEKWVNFRDTFDSLIDRNPQIDNVEKFYYLQSSLKGEAAQIISSLAATDSSYVTAWSLLKSRYENKKAIIHCHMKGLFDIYPVKEESYQQLRKFLDTFQKHYKSLENLGENVGDWSTILLYLLNSKIDLTTRKEWEIFSKDMSNPSTENFIVFLSERCSFLESLAFKLNSKKPFEKKIPERPEKSLVKSYDSKNFVHFVQQQNICPLCKQGHFIYSCKKFIDLPVESRFSEAKRANLCTNCLRSGHRQSSCKSVHTCRTCKGKHHTLLHAQPNNPNGNHHQPTVIYRNPSAIDSLNIDTTNTNDLNQHSSHQYSKSSPVPLPDASENPCSFSCTNRNPNSTILLSTAVVKVYDSNHRPILCRAILDNGSQSNFITEELFQKLDLAHDSVSIPICGINQKTTNISKRVRLDVRSNHNGFNFKIPALVIDKISESIPQFLVDISNLNIPNDLPLADTQFFKPSPLDMLIGAGLFFELMGPSQIKLGKSKPILQESKLGWIISGPISSLTAFSTKLSTNVCTFTCTANNLQNSLERFWTLEEPPEYNSKPYSPEEMECESHFESTTTRDDTGRFQVSLPLKPNINMLGDSLEIALKRFYAVERKLTKNPFLKETYTKFMNEYADLGHMSVVDHSSANNSSCPPEYPINYLPHHCVEKKDSLTTRLRVVFDGSSATSSGLSLNNTLMNGPNVQNDIFSILLRFRQHNFVFTGDIAKMYRQILIEPHQRNLQRILWRDDPSKPLFHYNLNTVTYGLASSSYLATRCLKKIALDSKSEFPKESSIIELDCYVDDILTGAATQEELLNIRQGLVQILKSYGFDLRKFASNSPNIISDISLNTDNTLDYVITDSQTTKTLGVLWNSQSDAFIYYSSIEPTSSAVSKRKLLSTISKIFDPLGLLGPMIIQIKILLQQLWLQKIDWDEPIPPDCFQIWQNFISNLMSIESFIIPRQMSLKNPISLEIHGFCDASIKAYGACLFIRATDVHGQISSHLLCAKSRVAPLKSISLPRMELCGALVLAKLMKRTLDTLDVTFEKICYYTDSTIVLCWLSLSSRQFKTFVCNRVSEIQQISDANNWHHISSSSNPADIITRGINPDDLLDCRLWWHGPSFLSEPTENWPVNTHISNFSRKDQALEILEFNPKSVSFICQETSPIFLRYSSYPKLINVVAYCFRFSKNSRISQDLRITGLLTTEERFHATYQLIKLLQVECFSDELQRLNSNNSVRPNSKLSSLNPFIDEHGIIRVGGRLNRANIDFNSKHPIVIPSRHPFTKLLITHAHIKNMHSGCQATLSFVRQNFWPLNGKTIVRSIIRKCVPCFHAKPRPLSYIMGDLPSDRVTPSRPFLNVGIDYAGPFLLKDSKFRNKRILKCYVCVFVCLTTRAVHIELASELTTACFLSLFRRFVSRRGLCHNVYSDNGSNFVGAQNELLNFFKILKTESVQYYINEQNIRWHFIPSRSPHFGGIWEGAVKSVKHHLRRVLNNNPLYYEEFYTLLVQIEAVLNSRPLSAMSSDPNDYETLTPGHFIIGHPINMLPDHDYEDVKISRLTRYQHLQNMLQGFWSRWSNEYLHTLHQRSKWKFQASSNQLVGALVLLKEDHIPPCQWVRGRISAVHPGSDGVVRVVTITTPRGTVKRSVVKVCVLPIDDSSPPQNDNNINLND